MGNRERNKKITKVVIRVSVAVVAVLLAIFLSLKIAGSDVVQDVVSQFGYLGVLFVSMLSGFNIVVPIPAVTLMPVFTASGLTFWSLILVITVGMTLGDTIGFMLGDAGRKLTTARAEELRSGKVYQYIQHFREKHKLWPYIVLAFYAAFAPAPNEVLVIPMAFAGYPLRYMFPVVFIGNFVFNILVALGIMGIVGLI